MGTLLELRDNRPHPATSACLGWVGIECKLVDNGIVCEDEALSFSATPGESSGEVLKKGEGLMPEKDRV